MGHGLMGCASQSEMGYSGLETCSGLAWGGKVVLLVLLLLLMWKVTGMDGKDEVKKSVFLEFFFSLLRWFSIGGLCQTLFNLIRRAMKHGIIWGCFVLLHMPKSIFLNKL